MLVWSIRFEGRADVTAGTVSFEVVAVAKPEDANVIVGRRISSRLSTTCTKRWSG
jgi:hypothetical protein